jgi:recombinational DNA repair protein (RecF pathway)
VKIFTKDFGLITVISQGTRLLKSKLRYGIQEMTYGNFSFVRGKEYWRLTSAEKLMSFADSRVNLRASKIIKSTFNFIDRFIKGEERVVELFDFLEKFVKFILVPYSKEISKAMTTGEKVGHDEHLTAMALLNVLSLLGYTTTSELLTKAIYTEGSDIEGAISHAQAVQISIIDAEINKIISETHL